MDPVTLTAIGAVFAVLVIAATDPQSFINTLICGLIDIVSIPFPSTPNPLKLSAIVNTLASSLPIFGRAVIESIISTVRDLFVIYFLIKIYKLIPFKAT
jgi:hypothetical protein